MLEQIILLRTGLIVWAIILEWLYYESGVVARYQYRPVTTVDCQHRFEK